jgi:hypothetical protein
MKAFNRLLILTLCVLQGIEGSNMAQASGGVQSHGGGKISKSSLLGKLPADPYWDHLLAIKKLGRHPVGIGLMPVIAVSWLLNSVPRSLLWMRSLGTTRKIFSDIEGGDLQKDLIALIRSWNADQVVAITLHLEKSTQLKVRTLLTRDREKFVLDISRSPFLLTDQSTVLWMALSVTQ